MSQLKVEPVCPGRDAVSLGCSHVLIDKKTTESFGMKKKSGANVNIVYIRNSICFFFFGYFLRVSCYLSSRRQIKAHLKLIVRHMPANNSNSNHVPNTIATPYHNPTHNLELNCNVNPNPVSFVEVNLEQQYRCWSNVRAPD